MRVAVTGATGFIGRHLVAHLAGRGWDVCGVVRPDRRSRPIDAIASTDLTADANQAAARVPAIVHAPLARPALDEAFRRADVVVHLAGVVSALHDADYFAVNVDMTRAVAEAAQATGARLVHISSLAAAGPAPASAPRSEPDPPSPITTYGRSKLEGEHAVARVDGLRWTILRPGVVYGPGDRALLPLFRLARVGYLPLIGRPGAAFTFINVVDLVRAIVAAIEIDADREIVFAGHPHPVTTRDLLEAVRDAAGHPASIVRVPSAVTYAAAVMGDVAAALCRRSMPINSRRYREVSAEGFVCRVDRLRDRLGVVAETDLSSGLDQTAQWYRRQRWL